MTFLNEGEWDRGVRMVGGLLLVGAGWLLASGTLGAVLMALGAISLVTGVAGWCPAYTAFGFSTKKIAGGHRPGGEPGPHS
jgi:hypothetical protein